MLKKIGLVWLLIISLTLTGSRQTILAQTGAVPPSRVVTLTDTEEKYPLGLYLDYLADPLGQLTIAEVSSPEYDAQFIPSQKEVLNFGINPQAHWVRFHLQNQSSIKPWLLEVDLPVLDYVDLYLPQPDGTFQRKAGGDLVPFNQRDVQLHTIAFSLPRPSSTETTYYLRFKNKARLVISMNLWQPQPFAWQQQKVMFGLGLFYGVMLIMMVYSLFLSGLLRDRLYLYYAVYLAILGLSMVTFDGLAYQYLWPSLPYWNDVALYTFVGGGVVITLFFSAEFLRLKHYYPRLNKLLAGLAVVYTGLTILYTFITQNIVINLAINPGLMPAAALLIGVGLAVWRRGYRPAKYYLLFWGIICAATFIQDGSFFQLLPVNFLTENAMRIGLIIALPLLSLALADRVNITRQEKEVAQALALRTSQENERLIHEQKTLLEQRVAARTYELTQTNQRLEQEAAERQQAENQLRQLSQAIEQSPSTVVITDLHGTIEYVNPHFTEITGYTLNEAWGQNPRLLKSGQHSVEYYQNLWQTINAGAKWQGEFVNRKKNGELYTELASISPIRNAAGEITHFLKVAEDITLRVQMEADLQKVYHELAALFALSTNMTSTLELPPLLKLILERLQNVIDFHSATIITLTDTEAEIRLHVGPRARLINITGLRFNLADYPALGSAVIRHAPLYLPNAPANPDFNRTFEHIMQRFGQLEFSHLQTWLFIPLVIRQKVIGLLTLVHEEKNFYNERIREFAQAFANQTALAIENATLYQQAQTAAVTEERNRLARELHDSVTQTLYSINLFTNATAMALVAAKPDVAQGYVQELRSLVNEAMLDMRLLIFELRPPLLEEGGLVAALRARLDAVESRAGIKVEFEVTGEDNLSLLVKGELYRIGQEALTNVVKHAQAQQVMVRLIFDARRVTLEISDNGLGFDLKNAQQSGKLGLRSMAERAEKIKGALTISSAPGRGATIRVEVDIEEGH